ncbi:MAG TPA: rhomboid family intramembrane serine protease [Gemmatimonadales bacterium]|nr:rhomboid family intramembrane serine protease [Gemmatimonadales bacterium]
MQRCPECEARDAKVSQWLGKSRPKPLLAWVLCALNVACFLVTVAGGAAFFSPTTEQLLPWGAEFGPLVLAGQWWRLIAAMFLHFGILHLAFNMWCLLQLGGVAEFLFGRVTFLALYLLSGLGGGVLSLLVHPTIVSAGASGAIFGVAGATVAFVWLHHLDFHSPELTGKLPSLGLFIVYNLMNGFSDSGIDNAAHFGGLIAGATMGALVAGPTARAGLLTRLRTTAAGAVVAALVTYGAVRAQRAHGALPLVARAQEELEASHFDQAIATLDSAVGREPDLPEARALLGIAYELADRPSEALPRLNAAIAQTPDNGLLFFYRGNAELQLGRLDSALVDYTTAIRLMPEAAEAYLNRGLIHANGGKTDSARDDFSSAVRLSQDTALTRKARELLARLPARSVTPARPR